MKGLLIKDFKLLKNNAWFVIGIVVISILCSAIAMNPFFALGYATSFIGIFSINTISYDEFDNGMSFLFTLPISRKEYVKEKYIYAILVTAVALFVAIAISGGVALVNDISYQAEEWVGIIISSVFLVMVIMSVVLPVRLKYDAEKNKMAMFLTIGLFLLTAYALFRIAEYVGIDFEHMIDTVLFKNPVITLIGVLVAGVILLGISYMISVRIMSRREF